MKSKILIYSVSTAVLVVAAAVAYYFAIALPNIQKGKQALEVQKFELQKAEKEKEDLNNQHYSTCSDEANEKAKQLLKNKIEIALKSGTSIPATWKEASKQGMYLKDDYQEYYDQCLQRYGLK